MSPTLRLYRQQARSPRTAVRMKTYDGFSVTSFRIWSLGITVMLCVAMASCDQVGSLNGEQNTFPSDVPKREPRSVGNASISNVTVQPLNGELERALDNIISNTFLILEPGLFNIEQFSIVSGVRNIAIIGQDNVTITCSQDIGLVFVNVSELLISRVHIEGCGLSGVNLEESLNHLRQFVNLFYVFYSEMKFAVFLGHCENVKIDDMAIKNNIGFGLVGINVIGSSVIYQLHATNNTQSSTCGISDIPSFSPSILSDPSRYGGGAVFLYQDYLPSYQQKYNNRNFSLVIEQGLFEQNSECSFEYLNRIRFGDPVYVTNLGYRIGGGGGLALILSQLNYSMNIVNSNSHFEENIGILGASAHVSIFSGVKDSAIIFRNCAFHRNGVNIMPLHSVGGGLGIVTDLVRPELHQALAPHVVHNLNISIQVIHSNFTDNTAGYGAAIYFYAGYRFAVNDLTDVMYLLIKDCIFAGNKAFIGSALQLYEYKLSGASIGTQINIRDTKFINNKIVTTDLNLTQSVLQSAGVVDIRNLNVTVSGECLFIDNFGTALRGEMSYIGIDGNVTFIGNIGVYGGALHLVSYTTLIMLPNSSLYLIGNVGRVSGGAIYSNFVGMNSYVIRGRLDCFLAFDYKTLGLCVNCSDLNSTGVYLKFENNIAPTGSHIFGSAFLTCPWASNFLSNVAANRSVLQIIHEKFPNIFDFDKPPVGPDLVGTQSSSLTVVGQNESSEFDSKSMVFNVLPGEVIKITLRALDDFQQIISNIVSTFVFTDIPLIFDEKISAVSFIGSSNRGLLRSGAPTSLPLTIIGTEGQNLSITLFSLDSGGRAQTQITVNIGYCGDGFEFNQTYKQCMCLSGLELFGVTCDINNQLLLKRPDLWVGPVDANGTIGVQDCLQLYCQFGADRIPVVDGVASYDSQCTRTLNRRGVLCGECLEEYSRVLGSTRCLICSNVYILLFPVFLLLGILLIFVIYFIDITVTKGIFNGAIFFSNVVAFYSKFLFPANAGGSGIFVVSFLSLNFGIETCLYDGLGDLDRIAWQLTFPLYLFLLMGTIALIARTRYFKPINAIGHSSITRACVTLMVLSYVSVLDSTVEALGFVTISTVDKRTEYRWLVNPFLVYFSGWHAFLAVISILLIVVYIIPFPIFLLFPSLIYRSHYLSKYKPLYDAFWDPFEQNFRFWLSCRLIFRWLIFGILFIGSSPVSIFVTDLLLVLLLFMQLSLKPFKSYWVNVVDSIFILILIAMFTGSLFFIGQAYYDNGVRREEANERATTYNTVFIVIAFLIMVTIFFYHTFIRFPKLKTIVLKSWAKMNRRQNHMPSNKNSDPENVQNTQPAATSTETLSDIKSKVDKAVPARVVITSNELREPLLEDCGEVSLFRRPNTYGNTFNLTEKHST